MATPTDVKTNPPPQIKSRVPPPPRIDDDMPSGTAMRILMRYMADLHQQFENGEILQRTDQSEVLPTPGDSTLLPDPSSSTIATAQKTANDAFIGAVLAQLTANAAFLAIVATGTITVSGASTTGTSAAFPDVGASEYHVSVVRVSDTGAPTTGSSTVIGVTKGTTTVAIEVATAPGVGTTVTFDFIAVRKPVLPGGA